MGEGFLTNLDTAMLFFRFCRRYKIDSREGRTALIREITRRGKAKYIRDVAEFTQGKKVVRITKRGSPHVSN